MGTYRYEASDPKGQISEGLLEADNARLARAQLRTQGLVPLSVDAIEAANQSNRLTAPWRARLSLRQRATVMRQLGSLLQAGLPLDEALSVQVQQADDELLRARMASIRADVIGGQSLASAMASRARDFPEIDRAMIAAGEHTGRLGQVLERLADYLDAQYALRQKVILAFTYPAIVSVVAILVMVLLMTYVVPQVVHVFENARQTLPLLTRIMLFVSAFVRQFGWLVILAIVVAIAFLRVALRQPTTRLAWDRNLLRVPILNRQLKDYDVVRFVSTLAILLEARVPILSALDAAGATLTNFAIREAVRGALANVREGSSLWRALLATGMFPASVIYLARAGETTGDIAPMLQRAADGSARDLERRTLILTTLLEPLLILVMGGMVLFIVLAVMMPIIELNQLIH